ncbi:MAG: cytochrome c nitrite reductase small subunit [Phycisphaerales bacterium]|jgi:cytochrome c nitrite reductase small subunit|nr:cytochrome c nitrite reductase small subunit [Phycisphaerales bacterium]
MSKVATASLVGSGLLAVALALGLAVGAGSAAFVTGKGTAYLSDDPSACVNCHVMQANYDGWMHGTHGNVATCNDCHVPHDSVMHKYLVKAEHGARHSYKFTFDNFHEPIAMTEESRTVVVNNCVRCHEQLTDQMAKTNTSPAAFSAHGLEAGAADCLHCHARVGHGGRK